MSRFDPLFLSVLEAVAASELLGDTFMGQPEGWMGWDLPPPAESDAGYPCLRLQLLNSTNTRAGEYKFNLSLWLKSDNSDASKDSFLALADELEAELNRKCNIMVAGYLDRGEPSKGVARALYPITYIAGIRPKA
jgi:hypothetical protein